MSSLLHNFAQRHHLVLPRSSMLRIVATLAWCAVLRWWLQVRKRLSGVRRPVVHYYAVCYNEERILPFVLDYYGRFADRFVIYDNHSTDSTLSLLAANPKVRVVPFATQGFDDLRHAEIKNQCWKHSRGRADFVVVCDVDEFAFAPSMEAYLDELRRSRVSLPTPQGFSMFAESFPAYSPDADLTQLVRTGVADKGYSKCLLFDPHSVVDINYEPGAHICHPTGRIVRGAPYKVLHYKNLDLEYVLQRTRINAARLSPSNRRLNLGYAYLYPEQRLRDEFAAGLAAATDVVS